jgi:hypothetical protein
MMALYKQIKIKKETKKIYFSTRRPLEPLKIPTRHIRHVSGHATLVMI